MIQKCSFPDGGFVLHKITGDFSGHCSAWYKKDGSLIDIEVILNGRARSFKIGGVYWQECERVGRIYCSREQYLGLKKI